MSRDTITLNPGVGGPKIESQKIDIGGGVFVERQVVALESLTVWKTSQVAVGISAVQIAATPFYGRVTISLKAICPGGVGLVYVGPDDSVTTDNGFPLADGAVVDLDLDEIGTVWAIGDINGLRLAALEIAR